MKNILHIKVVPHRTTLALEHPINCSCGKQLRKIGDILADGHSYWCGSCYRATTVFFDNGVYVQVNSTPVISKDEAKMMEVVLGLIDERDTCPCHDIILMKAKSKLTGQYVPLICVVHIDEETKERIITPLAELLSGTDNYIDPIQELKDEEDNADKAEQN